MAVSPTSAGGPRAVLLNVAENTTLHGVPNAYRSSSWVRKTIWSTLFLASFGMCLFQVISNFQKYYYYPTTSTSAVTTGHQLQFPAVTLCNMNPVRKSEMNQSVQDKFVVDGDWDNYITFQQWYAPLTEAEIIAKGHSLEHMLLSCKIAGVDCMDGYSHYFIHTLNGQYGNCYTFNGNASETLAVSSVGPTGGLILELYVDQDEYLPIISDTAGIRLEIHNQTYMPLPEKHGITLAPGFASNIAITRTEERRAKPPHGMCADVTHEMNKDINVYTDLYDYVDYTYQACRFTCYQQNVIQNCHCGDSYYPLSGRPFPILNGGEARPCATEDEQNCIKRQQFNFNVGLDNCTDACPMMCLEIFYEQKISVGLWPSRQALETILERIRKRLSRDGLYEVEFEATTGTETDLWIRHNVVKVTIYFERLDYTTHTTEGSYSVINLLSDQGGQVGLWLGLSVLTLFEMVELLWDLLASVFRPANRKSAPATGSDEPENPST